MILIRFSAFYEIVGEVDAGGVVEEAIYRAHNGFKMRQCLQKMRFILAHRQNLHKCESSRNNKKKYQNCAQEKFCIYWNIVSCAMQSRIVLEHIHLPIFVCEVCAAEVARIFLEFKVAVCAHKHKNSHSLAQSVRCESQRRKMPCAK